MPRELTVTRRIPRSADEVWTSVADFGNTAVFNPEVLRSRLVGGAAEPAVGVRRRCEFDEAGRKWTEEELLEFDHADRRFTMRIVDGPSAPPVDDVRVTMAVVPAGPGACEVQMHAVLTPANPFQRFTAVVGARMLRPVLERVLAGLDHHVRTGEPVTDRRALADAGVEV